MHKTNNVVQCGAAFEFIGVSGDAYLCLAAGVWHRLYQPHSVSSQPPYNQVLTPENGSKHPQNKTFILS